MSLHELLAADHRLGVLLTLGEADGYRLNDSVLRSALSSMALTLGRDDVRGLLEWLERQGLLRIEKIRAATTGELWIATLTQAGDEVRQGRHHNGVKRPEPL